MTTSKSLISVIIPAYNAAAFIARTIESVLAQTYQYIEVLVIDDGSQDETVSIVKSFMEKENRICLLRQPNRGVAVARNIGIQSSHGEFIAPVDADDIWLPNYLEKQLECMLKFGKSVGMVYAWSFDIDEQDYLTGGFQAAHWKGNAYFALACRNFIGNASAVLLRRCCLEQVGNYDPDYRNQGAQGCEDIDLYLRVAAKYAVQVVPYFLVGYRQVNSSMSKNLESMAKSQELVLQNLRLQNPSLPAAICRWSLRNFYIYLAHQSNVSGRYRESWEWLVKALNTDWFITILSHDTYILSLSILVDSLSKRDRVEEHFQPCQVSRKKSHAAIAFSRQSLRMRATIREFLPARLYEKTGLYLFAKKKPVPL